RCEETRRLQRHDAPEDRGFPIEADGIPGPSLMETMEERRAGQQRRRNCLRSEGLQLDQGTEPRAMVDEPVRVALVEGAETVEGSGNRQQVERPAGLDLELNRPEVAWQRAIGRPVGELVRPGEEGLGLIGERPVAVESHRPVCGWVYQNHGERVAFG